MYLTVRTRSDMRGTVPASDNVMDAPCMPWCHPGGSIGTPGFTPRRVTRAAQLGLPVLRPVVSPGRQYLSGLLVYRPVGRPGSSVLVWTPGLTPRRVTRAAQ